MKKKRLDMLVQMQYPHLSRAQIQRLIGQGKVQVAGKACNKASRQVPEQAVVTITQEQPYVSRAGEKLAHALAHFIVDLTGMVVLDAGLSTGGFTDCLLQKGATHIYGVDVGTAQVHPKIKDDSRVTVMEQTNLRHLSSLPQPVDMVTLDLSFISVTKVLSSVTSLMKPSGKLIILIKPQFELDSSALSRGGLVKDPALHELVIEKVIGAAESQGFRLQGITESPIDDVQENKEFLAYLIKEQIK